VVDRQEMYVADEDETPSSIENFRHLRALQTNAVSTCREKLMVVDGQEMYVADEDETPSSIAKAIGLAVPTVMNLNKGPFISRCLLLLYCSRA